jgi:predicted acyl esterase
MPDPAIRTDFPRKIMEIENTWIPMPDGTRLAARIWLPEDAEADPVPPSSNTCLIANATERWRAIT